MAISASRRSRSAGGQFDVAGLLRALALQVARNLGQLFLLGLFDHRDLAVLFRLFQREVAADIGQFLLARLLDQGDLLGALLGLDGQAALNLGLLALLGLLGNGQFTIRALAFQLDLVRDFPLLDGPAAVQKEDLLLGQLLGLLVGDVLVLGGLGESLLTLDLQKLQLSVQILLADRDGGLLFGVVDLALGGRGDLGDDLQTLLWRRRCCWR